MASKLVPLPCVDEDGYFCGFQMVMQMPDGELLLSDDVVQLDAPAEDPATAPSFYRLSEDKTSWIEEPKPKTVEDCAAMGAVSHKSQTARCNELRQLYQKLAEGSETHRITRGPDLEWIVEKIPEKTVEEVREDKLRQLDSAFNSWYQDGATMKSSLGFDADSDSRAMQDVNGLVTAAESQATFATDRLIFMDANNVGHPVTLEQLKTLQLEIIQSGNAAYQEKWKLRDAIAKAATKEELEAIEIAFHPVDFTAA